MPLDRSAGPRLVLVFALAALAAPGLRAQGSTPAQLPSVVIGVVDVQRLIDEHPKTQPRIEKLQADFRAKIAEVAERRKEAQEINSAMELLVVGSRPYLEKVKQLRILRETIELELEILRVQYDLNVAREIRTIYLDVQRVVGIAAKQIGVNLVLQASRKEIDGETRREVEGQILSRGVVHVDEALDFTDQVLALLKKG